MIKQKPLLGGEVNGQAPLYGLSHYPPNTRWVSLETTEPDDGGFDSLSRWLKQPDRLRVVDITI